jgi:hypothetical protein
MTTRARCWARRLSVTTWTTRASTLTFSSRLAGAHLFQLSSFSWLDTALHTLWSSPLAVKYPGGMALEEHHWSLTEVTSLRRRVRYGRW